MIDGAVREMLALLVVQRARLQRLRAADDLAALAYGADLADEHAAAAAILRMMRPAAARAALRAMGRPEWAPPGEAHDA